MNNIKTGGTRYSLVHIAHRYLLYISGMKKMYTLQQELTAVLSQETICGVAVWSANQRIRHFMTYNIVWPQLMRIIISHRKCKLHMCCFICHKTITHEANVIRQYSPDKTDLTQTISCKYSPYLMYALIPYCISPSTNRITSPPCK